MKFGMRVAIGVFVTSLAGALFVIKDAGKMEIAEEAGRFLAKESCFCLWNGQEGRYVLAELLGGQSYFEPNQALAESDAGKEKLAVVENRELQEGQIPKPSEPLVGDVEEKQPAVEVSNQVVRRKNSTVEQLRESLSVDYLWKNFYIIDSTTSVTKKQFDVAAMLHKNLKLKKEKGKKQILIYHTHGASEEFSDSKKNDINDSVVGVGTELTKELEKRGYSVYHDTTRYDSINGGIDRSLAYNKSLEGGQNIRKKNPDIKVLIDLHRDSVGKGKHTYTTIQGKKTAIVMFFNGMSRTKSGAIPYLYNPNLQGNLAFSLQMKCTAMEYYDGFTKPIYLKGYRYNLHLEPRSLLIELGNENNTVEEAKNAAAPLADVLDKVLSR